MPTITDLLLLRIIYVRNPRPPRALNLHWTFTSGRALSVEMVTTVDNLLLLATADRPVGNVKRNSAGKSTAIDRERALGQLMRAKRGKRCVQGLLFDDSAPGCEFLSWPHVVRRPSKQQRSSMYRGRNFDFNVESDLYPGVFSKVAVRYPSGSAPASSRAARGACQMLTQV